MLGVCPYTRLSPPYTDCPLPTQDCPLPTQTVPSLLRLAPPYTKLSPPYTDGPLPTQTVPSLHRLSPPYTHRLSPPYSDCCVPSLHRLFPTDGERDRAVTTLPFSPRSLLHLIERRSRARRHVRERRRVSSSLSAPVEAGRRERRGVGRRWRGRSDPPGRARTRQRARRPNSKHPFTTAFLPSEEGAGKRCSECDMS